MKFISLTFMGLLALLLSSCLPKERFWWAPDGQRAVVALDDGLHLVQADGLPGPLLLGASGESSEIAATVSWQQDGNGFVTNRIHRLNSWAEVKKLIPQEEAAHVETLARSIPSLIAAWIASKNGEKTDEYLTGWSLLQAKESLAPAIHLAYETQKDAVEAELRKAPVGAATLDDLQKPEHRYTVYELCLVKLKGDQREGEPASIVRSLAPLAFGKMSPKFPVVSYFRSVDEGKNVALVMSSLDGKSHLEIARSVSATCDWTSDGRSLVYVASVTGGEESILQYVRRATVLGAEGKWLHADAEKEEADRIKITDLALALMPASPRVIALPDGRVLFAGQPATLPAPGAGPEVEPRLFLVSADAKTVTQVPTAAGDLPENLGYFAASPDGAHVAVVESGTDAVAVVHLETGKTEIISPAHPRWQGRTLPDWKAPTELTFAALHDGTPQWMLWKQGERVRCISEKWPAALTQEWLEEKKKEEQPAAASTP